jgi:hypothetical protein
VCAVDYVLDVDIVAVVVVVDMIQVSTMGYMGSLDMSPFRVIPGLYRIIIPEMAWLSGYSRKSTGSTFLLGFRVMLHWDRTVSKRV